MTAIAEIRAGLKARKNERVRLVLGRGAERALIAGMRRECDKLVPSLGSFMFFDSVPIERTGMFEGWDVVPR